LALHSWDVDVPKCPELDIHVTLALLLVRMASSSSPWSTPAPSPYSEPSALPVPSPWSMPTPSETAESSVPTGGQYQSAWHQGVVRSAAVFTDEVMSEYDTIFAGFEATFARMDALEAEKRELLAYETITKSRSRTPTRQRKTKSVLPALPAHLHECTDAIWSLPARSKVIPEVPPVISKSKPLPPLPWTAENQGEWTFASDPPRYDPERSAWASSSSSSSSTFYLPEELPEETVVEERNVSVAMPNMLEVPPVTNDLPVQTCLAFNWIQRYAPWDLWTKEEAEAMQPYPLLPAQKEEHRDRKTLVLDLDETLVHCNVKLQDPNALPPEIPVQIKMSPKSTIPASVFLRPHCQELLARASELFEVIVFTASVEPYAMAVVDLLDKPRTWVTHVLSRDSCTELNGQLLKDLRRLGRDLKDVVLVDNSPLACGISPENSIICKSYYGNDPQDTELLRLRSMLNKLSKVKNMPEYLDARHAFACFVKQQRQEQINTGQIPAT